MNFFNNGRTICKCFLRNIGADHSAAGLGIHTLVFQVICSFFVSKSAKERFTRKKEWICSSCHSFVTSDLSEWLFCFLKSHRSKALNLLFKKRDNEQRAGLEIRSFAHRSFTHLLISLKTNEWLWAICSNRSRQMSDRERITQVAHDKWATVSDSLRLLMINK